MWSVVMVEGNQAGLGVCPGQCLWEGSPSLPLSPSASPARSRVLGSQRLGPVSCLTPGSQGGDPQPLTHFPGDGLCTSGANSSNQGREFSFPHLFNFFPFPKHWCKGGSAPCLASHSQH